MSENSRFVGIFRLVWSSPILRPEDLAHPGVRGVLFVGTGLGHVPRRCLDAVADLRRRDVLLAMTSQCLWGRVNLNVYSTGRDLLERGVVPGEDMLPEVALVKMMWCLAQTRSVAEAAQKFRTLVAFEFDPTTPFEVA